MKPGFAFFLLAAALGIAAAAVAPKIESARAETNLNSSSNLIDEGVAPPANPAADILPGVPLMPGLQIKKEDIDALDILPDWGAAPVPTAIGIADVDGVYYYYQKTLPSLGWQKLGVRDFMRDGKVLHINAQAQGKLTAVTFSER